MNKTEFTKLVSNAKEKGVVLRSNTKKALEEIESPLHSIVFTGCFQVGKSTLLNKVMLGSNTLLTEGEGLPTTAIPTKIVYGEKEELRVIYRDQNKSADIYNEITPELLRSLTTATGEEERIRLAREIRYIELTQAVESIKNFTFFDTPGVDDPNQDLIELTTADILPCSDLVVLVVDANSTLSQNSKDFLCKSIFGQGMSRVMILASYNPRRYKSAEERAAILQTIKAELALIGREYIPVHAFTYDENVDGDILRGPQEIMACLLKFIEENKEQAKIDKALFYLGNDIVWAVEQLRAKLEVSGKTADELAALDRKINSAAIELDAEYKSVANEFTIKFSGLLAEAGTELDNRFFNAADSVVEQFVVKFAECENLEQTRNRVPGAIAEITPVVQNILGELSASVTGKTKALLEVSSQRIAQAANRVCISGEFTPAISSGWVGKINPTLLKWIEFGGMFLFGGVFYTIGLLIINNIPVLKEVLPHNFTKYIVRSSLKETLIESLKDAKQNVLRQLEDTSESVKSGIKDAFAEIYADRIAPYMQAMENGEKNVLSAEEITQYKQNIANLNVIQKQCAI